MKTLKAITIVLSTLAVATPTQADVAGDLRDFWEKSGGGVNVTGPSSYNGQRAGFATMGSVTVRTRTRDTNLAHIQLPSARAGCGGIDIFGGSFSYISKEELIKLMEAIMQNAAGFAFELALESLSPAVQETVSKLRDLVQQVNSMNINSCESAQALTAALWPQMDGASQHICATIGSYQGMFADRIASKHDCGHGGTNSTLNNANAELKDQVPININYAWEAIKKNAFLRSDRALAEFFMTLTGTIITRGPANDSEGPIQDPIPPRAIGKDMVKALVEGGPIKVYRCNETDKCLKPTLQTITIPQTAALLTKTASTIRAIKDAIQNDGRMPDEAAALLGMTSVPVLEMIVTGLSYQHVFVENEIQAMAEVVAVDLAMIYVDSALREMLDSSGRVSTFGGMNIKYAERIQKTQDSFGQKRLEAMERYSQAMRTLERLALSREELAGYSSSRFAAMVGGQ